MITDLLVLISATEYAEEEMDEDNEQSKPLIDENMSSDARYAYRKNSAMEKRNSFINKSRRDSKYHSADRVASTHELDIANNQEVCPFGLAKNLEKQICVVPNRKS